MERKKVFFSYGVFFSFYCHHYPHPKNRGLCVPHCSIWMQNPNAKVFHPTTFLFVLSQNSPLYTSPSLFSHFSQKIRFTEEMNQMHPLNALRDDCIISFLPLSFSTSFHPTHLMSHLAVTLLLFKCTCWSPFAGLPKIKLECRNMKYFWCKSWS